MFKISALVVFRNRSQTTPTVMRVEEVNSNMFDTRRKGNGQRWMENTPISYDEWKRNHTDSYVKDQK